VSTSSRRVPGKGQIFEGARFLLFDGVVSLVGLGFEGLPSARKGVPFAAGEDYLL